MPEVRSPISSSKNWSMGRDSDIQGYPCPVDVLGRLCIYQSMLISVSRVVDSTRSRCQRFERITIEAPDNELITPVARLAAGT